MSLIDQTKKCPRCGAGAVAATLAMAEIDGTAQEIDLYYCPFGHRWFYEPQADLDKIADDFYRSIGIDPELAAFEAAQEDMSSGALRDWINEKWDWG